jgi:uncharacterized protein (UPF0332 family)
MKDTKHDLVLYRIAKARDTLEDARILANSKRWNPCVNRLYYACFYAVSALLAQDNLSSAKHTGLRSLFNQHYVKTEKISKQLAAIYNDLFERRQESDYMDFVKFEETQVFPLIPMVETFVEQLASLIEKKED